VVWADCKGLAMTVSSSPPDPPHRLASQQARFNRSTREHWPHFASHREQIERLLVADGLGGGGRLCVLGAGNCNDLDLPALAEVFDEIHLVDLDPRALEVAVGRQGMSGSPRVRRHAPVDLSAVAGVMATWPGRGVARAEIDECVRRVATAPLPALGGPFDLVLSPCALSQIVGYANDTLGPRHPRTDALRTALRDRHLRLMTEQVAPGGWGILITDVASSRSVPGLESRTPDELPDLLRTLAARGRCYRGLDPTAVGAALRADPLTAWQIADVQTLAPWLWKLGPLKTFLVYALRFRKAREALVLTPRDDRKAAIIVP
jgi:hypothetical protein